MGKKTHKTPPHLRPVALTTKKRKKKISRCCSCDLTRCRNLVGINARHALRRWQSGSDASSSSSSSASSIVILLVRQDFIADEKKFTASSLCTERGKHGSSLPRYDATLGRQWRAEAEALVGGIDGAPSDARRGGGGAGAGGRGRPARHASGGATDKVYKLVKSNNLLW